MVLMTDFDDLDRELAAWNLQQALGGGDTARAVDDLYCILALVTASILDVALHLNPGICV